MAAKGKYTKKNLRPKNFFQKMFLKQFSASKQIKLDPAFFGLSLYSNMNSLELENCRIRIEPSLEMKWKFLPIFRLSEGKGHLSVYAS
jgi:hypothetical protein